MKQVQLNVIKWNQVQPNSTNSEHSPKTIVTIIRKFKLMRVFPNQKSNLKDHGETTLCWGSMTIGLCSFNIVVWCQTVGEFYISLSITIWKGVQKRASKAQRAGIGNLPKFSYGEFGDIYLICIWMPIHNCM